MPIFEYECQSCSDRFEELMRRTDPDPACPACGATNVRRLISNTSFQLKGSGWYATDYASKSRSNGSTTTSKGSSSSSDKAETQSKAESKTSTSEAVAA